MALLAGGDPGEAALSVPVDHEEPVPVVVLQEVAPSAPPSERQGPPGAPPAADRGRSGPELERVAGEADEAALERRGIPGQGDLSAQQQQPERPRTDRRLAHGGRA